MCVTPPPRTVASRTNGGPIEISAMTYRSKRFVRARTTRLAALHSDSPEGEHPADEWRWRCEGQAERHEDRGAPCDHTDPLPEASVVIIVGSVDDRDQPSADEVETLPDRMSALDGSAHLCCDVRISDDPFPLTPWPPERQA